MWLPALALVIGVLVGLATGGKPRWAARHLVRDPWLVLAGVAAEVVAGRWTLGWLGAALLVGGYACLLAFVALNWQVRGIWLVGVGLLANLAVIVVNGGMPVRPQAVVNAGIVTAARLPDLGYGARHHAEGPSTHLAWLDDRLPVAVVHSVVSLGDVILAIGVVLVIVQAMNYQGRYQRRRLSFARRGS